MLLTSTFSAQAGTVFATASGSGFLWYRLRLTVAEMNYATRRMVELKAPWISGDSPLNPRQHPAATTQQDLAARPRPAAPITCRRPQPDRCAARPQAPAQIHTLTSGMPACRAPSSRPEPALLAAAAAVLPGQARAADGPSSKPGHGGHSRDQRSH